MSAFIDTSKIAVTDGTDTIWIKRRMDFGTTCRVEDTLTRMALRDGQLSEIHLTLGAQKLALALHNIVGWDGPSFMDGGKPVPCTMENIEKLDKDFPLFVTVRDRIIELNAPKADTGPLEPTTAGGPALPEPAGQTVTLTTST